MCSVPDQEASCCGTIFRTVPEHHEFACALLKLLLLNRLPEDGNIAQAMESCLRCWSHGLSTGRQ